MIRDLGCIKRTRKEKALAAKREAEAEKAESERAQSERAVSYEVSSSEADYKPGDSMFLVRGQIGRDVIF